MKKPIFVLMLFLIASANFSIIQKSLPKPADDFISLLNKRRSIRNYTNKPISLKILAYVLYAADARTPKGNRTAPSAGAKYPIDIYVFVNNVKGLKNGIYYYNARYHYLTIKIKGNFSYKLSRACYSQKWVSSAAANIVMVYAKERLENRYGPKALQFAYLEAGHISQNILLASTKLGIGSVPVGAFTNNEVLKLLNLNKNKYVPLYINPIGNI